jgi:hypothetical protein
MKVWCFRHFCMYPNIRWPPPPSSNHKFSRKYLYRKCLTLHTTISQTPFFSDDEWWKLLVLYLRKFGTHGNVLTPSMFLFCVCYWRCCHHETVTSHINGQPSWENLLSLTVWFRCTNTVRLFLIHSINQWKV